MTALETTATTSELLVAPGWTRTIHREDGTSMEETRPDLYAQLSDLRHLLETHYRDIQDVEFTIQDNKVYMLQTRTGKRTAAAAVAFDLGKPVRLVHFAQLLSAGGSGRGNSGRDHPVSAVFKEARLGDALLMISGIDVTDSPMGREEERALQLLTFEMSRYPGVTLLCCQASIDFDAAVHMLQPDLLRATKAVVQFSLPDAQTRAALWRRLVPSSCPFRGELDAEGLARESEGFSASRIRSCVYSAAGRAVLRSKEAARAEERRPATADGSPDIGPGASAFPHAGAPHALRMKELLEAVRDERDKMIGTRDVLQRSMVL